MTRAQFITSCLLITTTLFLAAGIKKQKPFIGFVQLQNKNLWMQQTEVTNFEYLEFLDNCKKESDSLYFLMLPGISIIFESELVDVNQSYFFDPTTPSTLPIKSFPPNNFKLYDMSGNVAEILLNKSDVKGGSFRDSYLDLKIDTPIESLRSQKPSLQTRFRCIMEIGEN